MCYVGEGAPISNSVVKEVLTTKPFMNVNHLDDHILKKHMVLD